MRLVSRCSPRAAAGLLAPPDGSGGRPDEAAGSGRDGPGGERLRIFASKRNNALLVYGTEAEYQKIYAVLRRIDVRAPQVMIEATIAEVTLNETLKYGTKAYFRTKWGSVALDGKLSVDGGFYSLSKASPSFAIEALQGVTTVKILSAPQLMVVDNEKARLQVGATVPIQTQELQSTTTAGAPVINSIDYRDTGVVLEITPRVASGDWRPSISSKA